MSAEPESHHDVFISYASEDKNTADAVCHALEDEGIRCWITPRDVRPGQDWKPAIVSAIENCEVMVLIFSSRSNNSTQVQTEVELAFESGHPIVPLRIEDQEMSDRLKYCVGSRHWLDAMSGSLEDHIEKLSASIQNILGAHVGETHDNLDPQPEESVDAEKLQHGQESIDGKLIDEIPSEINEQVTLQSGRYTLDGHLHVRKDGFLTIQPGTRISSDQYKIMAEGPVQILGESDSEVHILGGGLILKGPHVDESLVQHTVFSGCVNVGPDTDNGIPGDQGGGISLVDIHPSSLEVISCTFKENSGGEFGGAVQSLHSKVNLKNCTFEKNGSSGGGALKCESKSQVIVVSSTFDKNYCSGNYGGSGGAIFSYRSDLIVKESHFDGNEASKKGGAIYSGGDESDLGNLVVERSFFRENISHKEGGAIFVSRRSDLSEDKNIFNDNEPDDIFYQGASQSDDSGDNIFDNGWLMGPLMLILFFILLMISYS